jgi:hypothetical protein
MRRDAIWVLAKRLAGQHIAHRHSSDTVFIESLRIFTTHGVSRREMVFLVLTLRIATFSFSVGG